MSKKAGRNQQCPCRSGRKYKHCHGSPVTGDAGAFSALPVSQEVKRVLLAHHEAREFQRREQQGLGRPLISTQVAGQRVVAVGRTIRSSANWSTFHDFLRDYPVIVLGRDWWAAEMKKPPREQHKIIERFIRCREQASSLAGSPASEKAARGAGDRCSSVLHALRISPVPPSTCE